MVCCGLRRHRRDISGCSPCCAQSEHSLGSGTRYSTSFGKVVSSRLYAESPCFLIYKVRLMKTGGYSVFMKQLKFHLSQARKRSFSVKVPASKPDDLSSSP